jgi:hypothetical protein
MNKLFESEMELQKFHDDISALEKENSLLKVAGSAFNGAVLGGLVGWAVHRKGGAAPEIGRHAFYGAAIAGGASFLGYLFSMGTVSLGHLVEQKGRREWMPRATSHVERRIPGGKKLTMDVVWPEGVPAPPPGYFEGIAPAPVVGWDSYEVRDPHAPYSWEDWD